MRYTTIIDVTEKAAVYRNHNARLVYLHMVLKSGWHDNDRDLLEISVRQLAAAVGLTVSAVRHALAVLERDGLVKKQGTLWAVKKWTIEEKPTPRPRTKQQQRQLDAMAERRRTEAAREQQRELEAMERQKNFEEGKSSFMIWYESQEQKAAAGDVDAKRSVDRNRAAYLKQVEQMKSNRNER